jgi:phosphopantetheinyl transferase (holo-ACP synthase)
LLVGNDIVDLHDPESRPEALHDRFDTRVFTADEREALTTSASAHALRWTLWAAKESAYKVAKKLDPAVRFLPRDFVVRRLGEGRAVVVHETGPFDVRLRRTEEWVSAVATRMAANAASVMAANAPEAHRSVSTGIERLEVHGADPSQTVRELVCAALALRMNVPPGQVQIATDRGIPVARWRNRRLPVDLSLSHHGRFVAWAWVIGSPLSEAPAREPAA